MRWASVLCGFDGATLCLIEVIDEDVLGTARLWMARFRSARLASRSFSAPAIPPEIWGLGTYRSRSGDAGSVVTRSNSLPSGSANVVQRAAGLLNLADGRGA